MTYKGYDALYPGPAIPDDGDFYLAYEGNSANPNSYIQMEVLHPGKCVTIGYGDVETLCQDCESGAATPQAAVSASRARRLKGEIAIIYCMDSDEGSYSAVVEALANAGEKWADPSEWPAPGIYWWAVDWNGPDTPVPDPAIGVQVQNTPAYDLNIFAVNLLDKPKPTTTTITTPTPTKGKKVSISGNIPPVGVEGPTGLTLAVVDETTLRVTTCDTASKPTVVEVLVHTGADTNPWEQLGTSKEYTVDSSQVLTLPLPSGANQVWMKHESKTSWVSYRLD